MAGFSALYRALWMCVPGLAMAVAVTATDARACGYERCFGALALDPNGVTARASGQRTAPGAFERASIACGGRCDRIEVFHSGCAAMARAPLGLPEFGFGIDRRAANREALELCRVHGGKGCRVRAWVCSR